MKKLLLLIIMILIYGCKVKKTPEVIKTDGDKTLIIIDEHGRAHILRKPLKKR